jgi:D-lactate dehydrogenase
MKKVNPDNIYFFEVEKEDEALINKNFKRARIFREPFTSKNAQKCAEAEILCGMHNCDFSAKNLAKCENLKLIVTRTVGYDHIDRLWANERGIPVCNVPEYGSHVIAEHVFALLLASTRNILEGENQTEKGKFSHKGLRGMALKGKTIGVVGTGKIGMHVCRIASQGFLMNVIAYDKFQDKKMEKQLGFKYVKSMNDIWEKADIITLHVPLFPETQHMINAKTIAKMKDGVVLINTARGGLINTKDLIKAIKKGKFSDVALDVIENEENLKKDKEIMSLKGVIITPHIAFYADDSMENMIKESIVSIKNFLKGEKLKNEVV